MDIDFSNVFNLLRSHGHASGCYCSRITWTLIVYNVFILLRSHGHASRCYCSRIWTLIFPMCLSCCAVTAMRPDVLQPFNIWTLIVYNVFILLRSHGHASRCYCSRIWTLIFPMCLSCCAVTAMRPDVLQPVNIWTLIVYNVFILLRSHGHASRCYCSHLIYGH